MTTQDIFANQKRVLQEYPLTYSLTLGIVVLLIGIFIGAQLFTDHVTGEDDGYTVNLYTEIISVIATVFILDRINEARRKKEQSERDIYFVEEQRKRDQLQAISELEQTHTPEERQPIIQHMIRLKILEGIKLNLKNLEDSSFDSANLNNAHISSSNLKGARFYRAKLRNVFLVGSNMEHGNWEGADLQGADLSQTKLLGTNLSRCNLLGAYLHLAEFDVYTSWRHTTLPDGTLWKSPDKLERFTDPKHPEFDSTLAQINKKRQELGYKITFTGFKS